MVLSAPVSVAEADHEVDSLGSKGPVYAVDESCSIFRVDMVKAAEIEHEAEPGLFERKARKVPYQEIDSHIGVIRFIRCKLYCPVRDIQGRDIESVLRQVDRVRPRTSA